MRSSNGLRMRRYNVAGSVFPRDCVVENRLPAIKNSDSRVHTFLPASYIFFGRKVIEIPRHWNFEDRTSGTEDVTLVGIYFNPANQIRMKIVTHQTAVG